MAKAKSIGLAGELRMHTQLHVEALLHLSALVTVIAIAYLGLDRVHLEKDQFLSSLKEAQEKARGLVRQCDVRADETPANNSMFYRFPFWVKLKFYVICQIGNVNGKIVMGPFFRCMHFCHRQRHVPLYGYFTNRRDRIWVSIIAAISLVIFFYLTAAALWGLHDMLGLWFSPQPHTGWRLIPDAGWVSVEAWMGPIYWLLVIMVVWIIASVGVTHLLQRVADITDRLQSAVDDHLKLIAGDVARKSLPPDV